MPLDEQVRLFEPALQAVLGERRLADVLAGLAISVLLIIAWWGVVPLLSRAGISPLLLILGVPMLAVVALYPVFCRNQSLILKKIRAQMFAEGIRPAVCFDCSYYTEGFEGDECPNCGTALVACKPSTDPETN